MLEPVVENSPDLWKGLFPSLSRDGNKYTRGHALIYGGNVMTGAARLSARAAQRMGAGVVTLAAPSSALPIYAIALESVIVRSADAVDIWKELLADTKKNAVLIGPGAGVGDQTKQLVLAALSTRKPCVIDADAITSFENNPDELFSQLHNGCVLTPHEGEFARIFGKIVDPAEKKIVRAQTAAKLAGATVLLKGAETVIANAVGRTVINSNAPPWLATAGAGDVLAGMILGAIAQKMPVFEATAAAAWLHGLIASELGIGLISEDLVNGIPNAIRPLQAV